MKKKRKKTDRVLLGTLATLLVLNVCLFVYGLWPGGSTIAVTNQKAALYDESRIPELPLGGNVNINRADAALLDTLPGIGPRLAQRIIEQRETYGDFVHPEILTAVSGIGEKTYLKIAPHITIGE